MRKNVRLVTCKTTLASFINTFSEHIELEDINTLTDNSYSHNSLLAMRKDWNLFVEFCLNKNVKPIPASVTAVRLFLEKESRERKYATLKRYNVTISLVHKILQLSDPTSSVSIQNLLAQLRIEKSGDAQSTPAFNKKHLDELTLLKNSSKNTKDIRDLAIYHLMFECMLKRSELKKLTIDDLSGNTSDAYSVNIGGESYRLSASASKYIKRWLDTRLSDHQVLFSAIDKHGNISSNPLDDSSIYRILRAASEALGTDIQFSGHSLRVGAVNELAEQGLKVKEIQHFGRWKSAAMPYQYIGNRSKAALERMVFKSFKPWV